MKKPKSTIAKQVRQKPSKLEKAKERFVKEWNYFLPASHEFDFNRQLNNLIKLAREEGRKGK